MPGKPQQRALFKYVEEHGGWDWIFDRLAAGETQTAIAKSLEGQIPGCDPTFPSRTFLNMVLHRLEDGKARLAEARKLAAAVYVDEAREIVDAAPAQRDEIMKAKARADIRLWTAARFDRDAFGDQPQVAVQLNVAELHLDALRKRATGGTLRTAPARPALEADVWPAALPALPPTASPTTPDSAAEATPDSATLAPPAA